MVTAPLVPAGRPLTLTATVSSDEDPGKDGSGNTVPDWTTPVLDETGESFRLQLRAERRGGGRGRTYTIAITATDAAGNSTTAVIRVIAPHDLRGN